MCKKFQKKKTLLKFFLNYSFLATFCVCCCSVSCLKTKLVWLAVLAVGPAQLAALTSTVLAWLVQAASSADWLLATLENSCCRWKEAFTHCTTPLLLLSLYFRYKYFRIAFIISQMFNYCTIKCAWIWLDTLDDIYDLWLMWNMFINIINMKYFMLLIN